MKTRILAGGVHTAKQQIVRIDRVVSTNYDDKSREGFARAALEAAGKCDAILMSDYGTGLVTPELASALSRKVSERTRRRPVPVLIDSRYDLLRYRGLTACTPNESEVEQILGVKIGDNVEVLEQAGRELLKLTRMNAVLDHARQPRHGRVRTRHSRPFTSRSTDRTRWPTSPAPAIPSSRR